MHWSNVCVEGFCSGDWDDDEKYPCGRHYPTPLCLLNNHCPLFMWSDTTERMVAHFVPLRLIVWDKLKIWVTETLYWRVRWLVWDQLWFNRRKMREQMKALRVGAISDDDPLMVEIKKEESEQMAKFPKWFAKAKREW